MMIQIQIYGDEVMIVLIIIGELMLRIQRIDNDHVQIDIMYLVHENGIS